MGGVKSALSMGWGVAALIALYLVYTAVTTLVQYIRKKRGEKK